MTRKIRILVACTVPRPKVDHKKLAGLFQRHVSGDHYLVAARFAKQQKLSTLDLLKIRALMKKRAQEHVRLQGRRYVSKAT